MQSRKRNISARDETVTPKPTSSRVRNSQGSGIRKNKTPASRSKIQRILNTHRIYLDRQKRKPDALLTLVNEIKILRDGPPTPDSREIARLYPVTSLLLEVDAMISLEDYLGYRCEHQRFGEPKIYRGHNHAWRKGSVPCPPTASRSYLASALAAVGSPPDPRPDIAYGYTATAFTQAEHDILASLPVDVLVCQDEPFFPYFVLEWKSERGGGNMWDAERQAMRDGAGAVSAMWNWYRRMGYENPSAAETAMFSACVDSRSIAFRVHWRHAIIYDANADGSGNKEGSGGGGEASYEADLLEDGFLRSEGDNFRVRSVIGNILTWARDRRLVAIKRALARRLREQDGDERTRCDSSDEEGESQEAPGEREVDEDEVVSSMTRQLPTPADSANCSPETSPLKKQCLDLG